MRRLDLEEQCWKHSQGFIIDNYNLMVYNIFRVTVSEWGALTKVLVLL